MTSGQTSTQEHLSMPLGEAIFTLRAIRKLQPDPIPEADLHHILEATIQAPNGGNLQPWHYLVVQDPDARAAFAPLYREAWWAKRSDEGYDADSLPERYAGARQLADEIGDAPVLVLVCALAKGAAAAGSIIPSVQNLLLAARGLGVGGTITTLHPSVEDRVHDLFAIPPTVQIVYCVPLGYPRGRFGPVTRKPLAEVTSWDRWGQGRP